jgi:hypothetical protein
MGRDRHGDNVQPYSDGSGYCFARQHYYPAGTFGSSTYVPPEEEFSVNIESIAELPCRALRERGINASTSTRYGVRVEINPESGHDEAYYFPVYCSGKLVGYQRKIARQPGERQKGDVSRVGETRGSLPFGSHVIGAGGMVIVTEGGEDCLAVSQLLAAKGKNYRVCATLGTDGWKNNIEYFHKFDKVVIAFDQDDAGQAAAEKFAAALPAGKAVVMTWEEAGDPNELLFYENGPTTLLEAIQRAAAPAIAGVITGEQVWEGMKNYVAPDFVPYPDMWEILQQKTGGIREAEITMLCGGSSSGKTSVVRALKAHLLQSTDWNIGEVELEERKEKTWRGVMEAVLGMPWASATTEERREAWDKTYGTERIFTLDHRSQYGKGQSIVAKFKHLCYAKGCKAIFLDHVTLAVNEFGDGQGNSAQDQMMNEFLEFTETTGCHLFLISHLRKTGLGAKSFEEGAIPTMDSLKGCMSGDTEFLSPTGWVRLDQWSGHAALVVDPVSQAAKWESVEYVKLPNTKGFYQLKSVRGVDQLVSEEHRLVVNHNPKLWKNHFVSAEEFVAKHNASAHGSTLRIPTTYSLDAPGLPLTDAELRLEIACQADAHQREDCVPGHVQFMFTKERKYSRLLKLLQAAGVRYTDHGKMPSGAYCVRAWLKWGIKNFDPRLYQVSAHQAKVILDEVFHWDGTFTPTSGEYFTKHRDWADWMQHVFSLCGVRSIVRKGTHVWEVCTSRNNTVSLANKDMKISVPLVPSKDGFKYCFTTSTGAFVARRNGRVFITGNSGSLKQISFNIIGVSRNLQDPDDYERNCPQLHVLKSRETGDTGPADRLHWNNDTRSLEPARPRADEDTGDF